VRRGQKATGLKSKIAELPKDKPLVGSAFLLATSIKEALISFGKGSIQ
jgi:hypothetical protein